MLDLSIYFSEDLNDIMTLCQVMGNQIDAQEQVNTMTVSIKRELREDCETIVRCTIKLDMCNGEVMVCKKGKSWQASFILCMDDLRHLILFRECIHQGEE